MQRMSDLPWRNAHRILNFLVCYKQATGGNEWTPAKQERADMQTYSINIIRCAWLSSDTYI